MKQTEGEFLSELLRTSKLMRDLAAYFGDSCTHPLADAVRERMHWMRSRLESALREQRAAEDKASKEEDYQAYADAGKAIGALQTVIALMGGRLNNSTVDSDAGSVESPCSTMLLDDAHIGEIVAFDCRERMLTIQVDKMPSGNKPGHRLGARAMIVFLPENAQDQRPGQ